MPTSLHLSGPTRRRGLPRLLPAALGAALMLGSAPAAVPVGASAATPSQAAANGDLVTNGGFEGGTKGWRTNRKRQKLNATRPSLSGSNSAHLKTTVRGRVVLTDVAPTVTSAPAGATYTLVAHVRSTGGNLNGRLRVREVKDGSIVERHRIDYRATRTWKRLQLTFTTTNDGVDLDVSLNAFRMRPAQSLLVDEVSLVAEDSTPTTPGDPPHACVSDPMGIPAPGSTYLGAAVGGTSDLATRESQLGRHVALHRTFYQAAQITNAVSMAKADLKAGRLPWISFKAPMSWADMAAGKGNDWATQLADALATVPGPVWLAIHHEPEGDGDMDLWTQMQREVAPIIHARTDNVAYSVIYSGWNTYANDKDTVATKWPGDKHIDILAIDAYNAYGANRNGTVGTKVLDMSTYFTKMAAFAKAHGTAWALGETGQTTIAAQEDPTWLDRSYHAMVELGGAGFSYFDSSRNSIADWTLDDPIKFNHYRGLLAESAELCS
jgi:Cellulase (glycosyl hydrolase family 5)